MKRRTQVTLAVAVLVGTVAALSAVAAKKAPKFTKGVDAAAQLITGSLLRAHTEFLSDDLLEGRGPGTRGGELAAKYIAAEFARMGLEPGGDAGSYFQKAALLGKKLDTPADLRVVGRRQAAAFRYYDDFVPSSGVDDKQVEVEGELVFAGYGIAAPEYKWDDFKGTDVRDKILLILVNDPPATAKEPELFGGKALTYYGRWTYKYEQAARMGAVGVLLIHTTESAGYPFTVVQSSWTGEQFELLRETQGEGPLELKAWITDTAARRMLALAGQDLDALRKAAAERSFRPVALGLRAATEMNQTRRVIDTANVIGVLPGTSPKLKDEYVIYTAHYDHLGVGKPVNDDAIYNGAADNAIGVAALLAIAEAMAEMPGGTKRSQVFAAVTAEEAGLLGSAHYAR
ncbi:MAG: M28 family peptidase, partial [Candidatus Acidiferrales bacterium]